MCSTEARAEESKTEARTTTITNEMEWNKIGIRRKAGIENCMKWNKLKLKKAYTGCQCRWLNMCNDIWQFYDMNYRHSLSHCTLYACTKHVPKMNFTANNECVCVFVCVYSMFISIKMVKIPSSNAFAPTLYLRIVNWTMFRSFDPCVRPVPFNCNTYGLRAHSGNETT